MKNNNKHIMVSLFIWLILSLVIVLIYFLINGTINWFALCIIIIPLWLIIFTIYNAMQKQQNKINRLKNKIKTQSQTHIVTHHVNSTDVYIPNKQQTNQQSKIPTIECPYCHSTNTHKLSTISRGTSTLMFGLASSKIGKQWHCNKCGSDF